MTSDDLSLTLACASQLTYCYLAPVMPWYFRTFRYRVQVCGIGNQTVIRTLQKLLKLAVG